MDHGLTDTERKRCLTRHGPCDGRTTGKTVLVDEPDPSDVIAAL